MKSWSAFIITYACLFRSISALIITRTTTNSMDPFLGVPPQIRKGDMPTFTLGFPNDTISKYTLTLQAPNGTVSTPISDSLFTNTSIPGTPPSDPTTRFCISDAWSTISGPSQGSYSEPIEQVGNWTVTLKVTYYYGSNGYEYDPDGKVCISPPFSSETAVTKPVTMVVLPSSNGSSSPIPTPSASAIDLQGPVTGTPYKLTTTPPGSASPTSIVTTTRTSGDRPALIWEKAIGTVAAVVMVLTLAI